jgi:5-formyltetrahydrofolate cyclo-ligase
MTKKELRKIYLKKRMELTDAEYHRLNQQICEQFFSAVKLSGIHVIHTFLPIRKNKEVDTWLIIDRMKKAFPQVKIAIPRINNQTSQLEHYYFEDASQLKTNTWEIPEPVMGVPAPIEKIDAVLVPLLAFDKQGHRLGYGRGFYDRFLSAVRRDCLKIGLSFFEMAEKIEGIDETDIPLDLIITPNSAVVANGAE